MSVSWSTWAQTNDDLCLLQISISVVWHSRDLQLSRNTLYLLSPRLCFFIVLICELFVYRDDSLTNLRVIMRTEQSTKCFIPLQKLTASWVRKIDLRPPLIRYLQFQCGSSVVVLCCMFWSKRFGDVSPYVCSYHFSSVWVAEWSPLGKELPTRLMICSLYILNICNFSYFPSEFGFCFLQFLVIVYVLLLILKYNNMLTVSP